MAISPSERMRRQVRRLFSLGAVGTMSDAQLLDWYVSRRDEAAEAAFEELVIRHAPMVFRVCGCVLHDAHDAEDAFQAVFLVLARRAASIRRRESIASWLFGVATHVSTRARRSAARRRTLARRIAEQTGECYLPVEGDPDEGALHEEIDGLPERLRAPVVLCYFQGLTYEAAASRLEISEVVIRGRLARAREQLRRRLGRRGITAPAGLLVVGSAGHAQAAVPLTLIHSTVQIARGFAAAETAAVLARGVLNSMLMTHLRVATVLVCLGIGSTYWAWRVVAAAVNENGQIPRNEKVSTVRSVDLAARRNVRIVGKSSFIEAYERTPIYLKRAIHVDKFIVKLGDKVKKGDVLATLVVPELVLEGYGTKKAAVELEERRTELARELVRVFEVNVAAAKARLSEANAIVAKVEAKVDFEHAEVGRLNDEVVRGLVDAQVLIDARNRLKAREVKVESALATRRKAEAELLAEEESLADARADVNVSEAALAAAQSEENRLKASVGPLPLIAPHGGVIVGRNVKATQRGDSSPGPAPIYTIDKIDRVRVFVDIPDRDSNDVHVGTKATVLAKAYSDQPIPCAISRISQTSDLKNQKLRAEIDLPNPGGKLQPGMYAYVEVIIDEVLPGRDPSIDD